MAALFLALALFWLQECPFVACAKKTSIIELLWFVLSLFGLVRVCGGLAERGDRHGEVQESQEGGFCTLTAALASENVCFVRKMTHICIYKTEKLLQILASLAAMSKLFVLSWLGNNLFSEGPTMVQKMW